MVTYRPPGVYPERAERRYAPLTLAKSGVVGFVGITEKGPTDVPVHVTSLRRFHEVFGHLQHLDTYLEEALKGFFDNGGRECYVLRVAHRASRGTGGAARAEATLVDGLGRSTLLAQARDEGTWGNEIAVSVRRPPPRVRSLLTIDLKPGDLLATIKSTHGFERGTVVRITDGEGEVYRVVRSLDGKTLQWFDDQPLDRGFKSAAPTYLEPVEFELSAETLRARETYRNLSIAPNSRNYVARVVNGASDLIRVSDLDSNSPLAERLPVVVDDVRLAGGTDGIFSLTPDDLIGMNLGPGERYGLAAYEAVEEVDLLSIPDLVWLFRDERCQAFRTLKDVEVVQQSMISQCEMLKDRFALLDAPDPDDHILAQQWRLMFDTAYAALYFPWLVVDAGGEKRSIPPSGHLAGIFARSDADHGVHRAPANEPIHGITDLELVLQDEDIATLNERGINCMKYFPARGIRIWGARTVSSDSSQRFLNVRRVMNTIIRTMNTGLQWVVFEPNNPRLWKIVDRDVTYFLMTLWEKGWFKGEVPEEAFYVKCDEETNPPEVRDAGQVVVEVGVAPVRPAEYIVFRIAQTVGGGRETGE